MRPQEERRGGDRGERQSQKKRRVMAISRKKAGTVDKKKSGCHRMALSQVLLRLMPV